MKTMKMKTMKMKSTHLNETLNMAMADEEDAVLVGDSKTSNRKMSYSKEPVALRLPCCQILVLPLCQPSRRCVIWSCCLLLFLLATISFSVANQSSTSVERAKAWVYEHWGDGIFEDDEDGQEEERQEQFVADYLAALDFNGSSNSTDSEGDVESPSLRYYFDLCEKNKQMNLLPGTPEYKLAAADCGWGYNFLNSSARTKPWKVVLYGDAFVIAITDLLGYVGTCPASPKCRLMKSSSFGELRDADVIVIFQSDAQQLIHKVPTHVKRKQYKVLYWREAQMLSPDVKTQKLFDFEMGVHYYSGLLNPSFPRHPVQYMSGAIHPYPKIPFIPVQERTKFALSIISHCDSGSQRDIYIRHLKALLGAERIHEYGECGDRKISGTSINMATRLMARYKFYLAFENTIEEGYVTEKLFFSLNVPVLSIYFGAPNVPNITVTPSFIKVSDFKSPKELANYLLFLDENPEEYMKYHAWRTNPMSFTDEFLETLANKVAGPAELKFHRKRGIKRFPRTSHFCRLCDENYVQYAASTKSQNSLVSHYMSPEQIDRVFFNGNMNHHS